MSEDVVFHVRDYHALRDLMRARFPQVFTARGVPPVPLMVDACTVLENKLAGVVPPRRVRGFLSVWCRRPEYLQMMLQAEGQPRHGFDGNLLGVVTAAQVRWTRKRIEQRAQRQGGGKTKDAKPEQSRPMTAPVPMFVPEQLSGFSAD